MNYRNLCGLIASGFLLVGCGGSSEKEADAPTSTTPTTNSEASTTSQPERLSPTQFGVKAGHVEYTYTGKWTGTQSLWWDNWGDVAVLVDKVNAGFGANDSRSIWKDGRSTFCDLRKADKTCTGSPFRVKDSEPSAFAITSEKDLTRTNWTRLSDETIAGRTCEVFENTSLNVKGWRWNRVELKYYNGIGDFTKEATSFEEISAIPAELLQLPEGFAMK
jgi:hypothetical protein